MRGFTVARLLIAIALTQYSSCNSVRARSSPSEGRAFDFLSSLSSIRTNILSLLDNTFNTNQKKVRPPPPPPVRPATFHHVPVRPLPPRPAPGIFITSAPQLSSPQNSHFHAAPPQPHSFSLPQSVDTGPIVEVVQHKPTQQPERVEPPAIHSGPVSFVDSERLNAGSGLLNEIDNGLVHIPKDLWREDIGKIEHELKVHKKVKVEGSFETYKLY